MTARLLLPADAPRDQWLETRRALGVSASEIAAVMRLSPWQSPFGLYWAKLGVTDDLLDNEAMRWGRRLEAAIADEYADRHPEHVVRRSGLYQSTVRNYQLATPDREIAETADGDPVALLECKTSGSFDEWGDEGTDEIPVHYRCQVLWQLDVLGLDVAYLAVLLRGQTYREYLLERDPEDIALLRDRGEEFWKRVTAQDPPPLDWSGATRRTLQQLHPSVEDRDVGVELDVAREYRDAHAAAKAAAQRKDHAENELRAVLGSGRVAVYAGEKVASRSVFDRTDVDRARLKKDFPEAYAACRVVSTVDRLNPARHKAHPATVREAPVA